MRQRISAQTSFGAIVIALCAFSTTAQAVRHTRTAVDIPTTTRSLAGDCYLPPGAGPWPVILIQTPYNKNLFIPIFTLEVSRNPLLKSPDYAFVVVDWRGFFGSADAKFPGCPGIGEDGYDIVEWIATQPWCDGNVGTWGESALGTAQLLTALQRPPHLKACVPMVCHAGDSYGLWYWGGVYFKNRNDFVASYYGYGDLMKNHPLYDTFWMALESLAPGYENVETPMLFVSGWYDIEPPLTIGEYQRVCEAQARKGLFESRLLIGPWGHSNLGMATQNEREYPAAEFADSRAALAFFDKHLRGLSSSGAPFDLDNPSSPIGMFQMNENVWNTTDRWPPAGAQRQTFYLRADGGLSPRAPTEDGLRREYFSNPHQPNFTIAGALLKESDKGKQGPGDIRALIGAGALLYQTDPMTQPLRIAGEPAATLHVQSTTVDLDLAVRMVEVLPDGTVFWVDDGVRRASLRNDYTAKELLTPGIPVPVVVALRPIAVTIPAGNRLGVVITSTNYDLIDINPQDGSSFMDETGAVPTSGTVTILSSATFASQLTVPLLSETHPSRHLLVY